MRKTKALLLATLAAIAFAPHAPARQASLRTYDIQYAADDPFVGKFLGGGSIPSIGKHGFASVEIARGAKGRLDVVLTLAQFGMFRHRGTNPQIVGDVLRFNVPPPPGCTTAECELRLSEDAQQIQGMVRYYPEAADRPPARIVAVRRPDILSMDTVRSWTGLIDQENAPLELVLRVGTRPDGLVVGEFDIPEHQYYGASLANLQYEPDLGLFLSSIPEKVNGMLELEMSQDQSTLTGQYVRERTVSPAQFHADQIINIPRSFLNDAGGSTFGELSIPTGSGPFPCVLILGTFGPNDRNGVNVNTGEHEPYRRLADALTRRGYAVYRYDDRGNGLSRDSSAATNIGSLAADAAHALAMLASTPRVDPGKIILLGHGEGGTIAPLLLPRSPAPAGLILLNAPVGRGVDHLIEQTRAMMTANGMPESKVDARTRHNAVFLEAVARGATDDELRDIVRAYLVFLRENVSEEARASLPTVEKAFQQDKAAMANPMTRSVASWDNATALASAKVPVLAIFGSKDLLVPHDPAAARARQAIATGSVAGELVVLEGLNHYLQPADSGLPSEFPDPGRVMFDDRALESILDWLERNFPTN